MAGRDAGATIGRGMGTRAIEIGLLDEPGAAADDTRRLAGAFAPRAESESRESESEER